MKKILLLLLGLLVLTSFVYSNTLEYNLITSYPSSPPFYKGTKVRQVVAFVLDDMQERVIVDKESIDVKIGDRTITLYRQNDEFQSNNEFYIGKDMVKSGIMRFETISRINGVQTPIKTYRVESANDIVDLNVMGLSDRYTTNQDAKFKVELDYKKDGIELPKCYVVEPSVKNNRLDCVSNTCSGEVSLKTAQESMQIELLCLVNYQSNTIPLHYSRDISVVDDIDFRVVNPDENGIVYNPFSLVFSLNYLDGSPIKSTDFDLKLNSKDKRVRLNDLDTYSINMLLIPYGSLDENITILFRGQEFTQSVNNSLKPAMWFWITILIILFVLSLNIGIVLYKIFKKENINELIAKRDIFADKLTKLRKEYLAGKITKSLFDELREEYQVKFAALNSKIIKLRDVGPKEQYDEIKKTAKKSLKHFEESQKFSETPDELVNRLTNAKKKTDAKPKLDKSQPKEGFNFFSSVFGSKKDVPKKEEKKKEDNNISNSEFDISNWKK